MFKEFFVGLNFSCANSFGNYEEIAYGSVNNKVFTFLNNKNEFIFVTGERHTLSNEVIMFGLMEAPNFPKTEKSAAESLLLLQLEYDLQLEKIEAGIINPPISKRTILWSKGEKKIICKSFLHTNHGFPNDQEYLHSIFVPGIVFYFCNKKLQKYIVGIESSCCINEYVTFSHEKALDVLRKFAFTTEV